MSEHTFTVALLTILGASIYLAVCVVLWCKSEGIPLERDEQSDERSEKRRY